MCVEKSALLLRNISATLKVLYSGLKLKFQWRGRAIVGLKTVVDYFGELVSIGDAHYWFFLFEVKSCGKSSVFCIKTAHCLIDGGLCLDKHFW